MAAALGGRTVDQPPADIVAADLNLALAQARMQHRRAGRAYLQRVGGEVDASAGQPVPVHRIAVTAHPLGV